MSRRCDLTSEQADTGEVCPASGHNILSLIINNLYFVSLTVNREGIVTKDDFSTIYQLSKTNVKTKITFYQMNEVKETLPLLSESVCKFLVIINKSISQLTRQI